MWIVSFLFLPLASLVDVALAEVGPNQPTELVSSNGRLEVTLTVDNLESWPNGTKIGSAFNGLPVGPTLRVKQGDTLEVTLVNDLPAGSDLDRELYDYIANPQNVIDNPVNTTIIYNRLDEIGNIYNPTFGFWGLNFVNLHFHGAQFSPSIEDLATALDGGGTTRTYTYEVKDTPGLYWYHNHYHGIAAYSYLNNIQGFLIVEPNDDAEDITKAPGVDGAVEVYMMLAEGLTNGLLPPPLQPPGGDPRAVPPFFPIAGVLDWPSVTNGVVGEETQYTFTQGQTALFRCASATVEPTIRLFIEGVKFVIIAYDGIPLPSPEEVDVVPLSGGGRVEFLARFDTPGTYTMKRQPWGTLLAPDVETCTAAFGLPFYPCISYDVEKDVAKIIVEADPNATPDPSPLIDVVELPDTLYDAKFAEMAAMPPVATKTVVMKQAVGFPLFQIPYEGPFVPPGVGFGMNDEFIMPHTYSGTVGAGTCETWEVISDPPGLEHAFHTHQTKFMVTHIDGVAVETPFWRDTMPVDGSNITIHICFDALQPGEGMLVHCHAPSHFDIGMGQVYQVVNATSTAAPPTMGPTTPSASPPTTVVPTMPVPTMPVARTPTTPTTSSGMSIIVRCSWLVLSSIVLAVGVDFTKL